MRRIVIMLLTSIAPSNFILMQLFGSFANDVVAKKIEEAVRSDMPGKGVFPDDQAK